jgi:hypothetical protein
MLEVLTASGNAYVKRNQKITKIIINVMTYMMHLMRFMDSN